MTLTGFGATEFLTDMAVRGTDVTPWVSELNKNLLAGVIGLYVKNRLKDPLAPGNTLRDMQAYSAAITLSLYEMTAAII